MSQEKIAVAESKKKSQKGSEKSQVLRLIAASGNTGNCCKSFSPKRRFPNNPRAEPKTLI